MIDETTLIKLVTAGLLAQPKQQIVGCEHRLRVGINNLCFLCAVCKAVVNEPSGFGICVKVGPDLGMPIFGEKAFDLNDLPTPDVVGGQ